MTPENMRKNARRRLGRLIQKYRPYCHWCGERLVHMAAVPVARRIRQSGHYLFYFDGLGRKQQHRFATIDHITRIADGGDNSNANLALSCASCNQDRASALQPRSGPHTACCKCGAPLDKTYGRKRCCEACRKEGYAQKGPKPVTTDTVRATTTDPAVAGTNSHLL